MPPVRIPEFITVHLGTPDDNSVENVTLPFIEYIKNVASSEIYPTWPENALRANIYAQVSFALNRVYTEWYRSRGYDFDITSSTQYDQKFIRGREIFANVAQIVDEVFNDYIVRQGDVQPLFAQYCNGTTVTCPGLSQWGTVDLAREGLTPYEILQNYYGEEINIIFNAPTAVTLPSYPGYPLRLGDIGEDVRTIQRQLNRIGQNYPGVTPRLTDDGIFGLDTETAVKSFQTIFNLTPDGIVGKGTWYRIKSIFNAVKGLAELEGEGLSYSEIDRTFPTTLSPGDSGFNVRFIQYYLAFLALFNDAYQSVTIDGVYGSETEEAVRAFQRANGLEPDGIIGRATWEAIIREYDRVFASISNDYSDIPLNIYPGRVLTSGQSGRSVLELQRLINRAADNYPYIPPVPESGVYDYPTSEAISIIQSENSLPVTGITGPLTWETVGYLARNR